MFSQTISPNPGGSSQKNRPNSGIFIASTGQHIGKTTTCLGIFSGILKRTGKVGFIKPVGQEFVEVGDQARADKDVILFKEKFHLTDSYEHMSPVLFPKGFTRDYIDGKVTLDNLKSAILSSHQALKQSSDFILAEGTGHIGVGAIADIDNAVVAKLMDIPMVLIASGGLGSAFDSLALNKFACDRMGIKIVGVILNRVIDEKREMIIDYMSRALRRWDVPLLGAVPYSQILAHLRMDDYARLFKVPLLTGETHRYRYFNHVRLVATSNEIYEQLIEPRQLTITPASREDIVESTLAKYKDSMKLGSNPGLKPGIMLTGRYEPNPELVKRLADADIPMIYAPVNTFEAMQKITKHTAKIRIEDSEKVNEAIQLVENHTNIDELLNRISG